MLRSSQRLFEKMIRFNQGLTIALLPENTSIKQPGIITSTYNQFSSQAYESNKETIPHIDDPSSSSSTTSSPITTPVPPGHVDFSRRQMIMMFTCTKCDTRAAKAFSKDAYTKGVVIVECPGCNSKHLIADHLGWFGSKGTIEEFASEKGEIVTKKLADGTLELNVLSDIAGLHKTETE